MHVNPWPVSRPRGRHSLSSFPQGFTLAELLVVIGVLTVLASLALPALRHAREHARAVLCIHHLQQWGYATHLYAMDNEDRLPPEGVPNPTDRSTNIGWYIQLPRQLSLAPYHTLPWRTNTSAHPGRTIWLCPSNPRRSNGRNLFHYCLNQHLDGTSENDEMVLLSSVSEPTRSVWLFDSKNLPAVGYWGFVHTNLHRQGAQFLFIDGHAARFRNAEYWDFTENRGLTNNPNLRWIR